MVKLYVAMTCLLAAWGSIVSAQPAKPVTVEPAEVTRQFYRWYLQSLAKDRDPVTKDRATLRTYVSAACIAEIDRLIKSPDGLEADYFIQAQDFQDDWANNISVKETARNAATASELVTLGPKGPSQQKVKVELKNEKGSWKISSVAP